MPRKKLRPEERLPQKAEELKELREFVDETAFEMDQRDSTGELTIIDQHPADVADFTFQRELMETTRQIIDQEAQQTQDAMERRAQGQYGICEDCGRPIPTKRLEARPSATRCLDCQQKLEQRRAA